MRLPRALLPGDAALPCAPPCRAVQSPVGCTHLWPRAHLALLALLALLAVAACERADRHGEPPTFHPALTADHVAPALGGLLVAQTTLAEARAALPPLELSLDVRYGGSSAVGWNGRAAVVAVPAAGASLPQGVLEARWVFATDGVPEAADDAVLVEATLTLDGALGSCAWLRANLGRSDQARDCSRAHHVHVDTQQQSLFCLGTADTRSAVVASCERGTDGREQLRYALVALR